MKPKLSKEELENQAIDFREKLKALKNAPVEMNSDLAEEVVKDLPVERINTKPVQKIDTGGAMGATMAKIAERRAARAQGQGRSTTSSTPGDTIDYSKFKKAKDTTESVYDAGAAKKEYMTKLKAEKRGSLAKALTKGKLGMAMGPIGALAGAALAGSADEALANAVIPGGIEGLGQGSDMAMEDDTAQVQMAAEAATDHNLRRMALQELKSRSR